MTISEDEINEISSAAQAVAKRGAKSVQPGDQKVEFFDPETLLAARNALKADY